MSNYVCKNYNYLHARVVYDSVYLPGFFSDSPSVEVCGFDPYYFKIFLEY